MDHGRPLRAPSVCQRYARNSTSTDDRLSSRAAVGHRRSWFGNTATGVRQLITFHADGTVLRSVQGEASIESARPPHTPAHGVWRYLGNGRFGVTIWDLFYDVNTAQPLRYNRLRLEVTLGVHSFPTRRSSDNRKSVV